MRGVQPDGADQRLNIIVKISPYPHPLFFAPVGAAQEMNIFFFQCRNQGVIQNAVLALHGGAAQGMNGIQHLLRVHAIGPGLLAGKRQLAG